MGIYDFGHCSVCKQRITGVDYRVRDKRRICANCAALLDREAAPDEGEQR